MNKSCLLFIGKHSSVSKELVRKYFKRRTMTLSSQIRKQHLLKSINSISKLFKRNIYKNACGQK